MNTEPKNTTIMLQDAAMEEMPFVNEECGDTLWDEVLKNIKDKPEEE